MKDTLCMILSVLLVCTLFACTPMKQEIQQPVSFYYRAASISYNSEQGVISPEVRETAQIHDDLYEIMNLYLCGPVSEELRTPYPANTVILEVTTSDDITTVKLSKQFSALTGLDLTIACACLTKTVLELTGSDAICICADNVLLDGNETVTMSLDDLLLLDVAVPVTPEV